MEKIPLCPICHEELKTLWENNGITTDPAGFECKKHGEVDPVFIDEPEL